MKAPDKIYLQRNTTTDLYVVFWPEWFEDASGLDSDICYIRKDALLEDIKLAYSKVSMNPFDCQEAFEELLDKLNKDRK